MEWFEYPVCVPYGNANYDVQLGGSHDMDVQTPLGTPVTFLLSGTLSDISEPSWGIQVCLKLDETFKGIPYMAYLHLGYVDPDLKVGDHVDAGQSIGLSGGATSPAQSNGHDLFVNSPEMSSQPQTGIALMRGPVYGSRDGWNAISADLDPSPLIEQAIVNAKMNNAQVPAPEPEVQKVPAESVHVPRGWKYENNTLIAPNGVQVHMGFMKDVLSDANFDPDNVPEEAEYGANPVVEYAPHLGQGDRQCFRDYQLVYTEQGGVIKKYTGNELKYVRADRDNRRTLMEQQGRQIDLLKAGLPMADIKSMAADLQSVVDKLNGMTQ